ncbi:nitroreductase family protein [Desulfurella multipotens]|uniref:nitroreductase family protein n=1 Tax=Desulfurella multipotens TaxID=79269 RepID=UPI000CAEB2EF|nr:nitroreductase family protein [Desulfurella multipotens]PMP66588.1 MAG: nitroreductase [Desulfurella multipotens]
MNVAEAIEKRRSFRSLLKVEISQELIKDLAGAASLAPSCFNKQPQRFVFVYDEPYVSNLKQSLSKGNEWAYNASMIIAVLSKETDDCILGDRKYFLFDTGMSVAFLMLKAQELGYVAHPIAGYDPLKVRNVINSPQDLQIIALIIFGKHNKEIDPLLSEKQKQDELQRPPRKAFEEFACLNTYCLKD